MVEILKKGDKGEEVKELQKWLNSHGFGCGRVDGTFGPKTEKAVKTFQFGTKIKVDGIVGSETRKTMSSYDVFISDETVKPIRTLTDEQAKEMIEKIKKDKEIEEKIKKKAEDFVKEVAKDTTVQIAITLLGYWFKRIKLLKKLLKILEKVMK